MKRISEDKEFEIKAMLKSGLVGIEIASRTGVSLPTIGRIRKEVEKEGYSLWHRPDYTRKEK